MCVYICVCLSESVYGPFRFLAHCFENYKYQAIGLERI